MRAWLSWIFENHTRLFPCAMTSEFWRLTMSSARITHSSHLRPFASHIADRTSHRVSSISYSVPAKTPRSFGSSCSHRSSKTISLRTIVSSCFGSNNWWSSYKDRIVSWATTLAFNGYNPPFANHEMMCDFDKPFVTHFTMALRTSIAEIDMFLAHNNCH